MFWGRELGPFAGLSTGQLVLPAPHGRKEGISVPISTESEMVMSSDGLWPQMIRFDSVQPTLRCLINSLIFVKPVNDNVYVIISPVCL